jgi:SAM-dependent methyltransferase
VSEVRDTGKAPRTTLTRPLGASTKNTPAAWTQRANTAREPWEACGWSRESQQARFAKILDALDPQQDTTLLDYGCGTGQLLDVVDSRLHLRYIGFDWSMGMLNRARDAHQKMRFDEAQWTTMLRDGQTWDYVVCCGTFNLADNWSKAQTWALLRMLWARTTRAMAVSLYTGHDPACIRYVPSEVATTAGALAHSFTVERGYLPNDILLVLRR